LFLNTSSSVCGNLLSFSSWYFRLAQLHKMNEKRETHACSWSAFLLNSHSKYDKVLNLSSYWRLRYQHSGSCCIQGFGNDWNCELNWILWHNDLHWFHEKIMTADRDRFFCCKARSQGSWNPKVSRRLKYLGEPFDFANGERRGRKIVWHRLFWVAHYFEANWCPRRMKLCATIFIHGGGTKIFLRAMIEWNGMSLRMSEARWCERSRFKVPWRFSNGTACPDEVKDSGEIYFK